MTFLCFNLSDMTILSLIWVYPISTWWLLWLLVSILWLGNWNRSTASTWTEGCSGCWHGQPQTSNCLVSGVLSMVWPQLPLCEVWDDCAHYFVWFTESKILSSIENSCSSVILTVSLQCPGCKFRLIRSNSNDKVWKLMSTFVVQS